MKLTKYGLKEWLSSGIIALVIISISIVVALKVDSLIGWSFAVATAFIWVAIAAFFRDPSRVIPEAPDVIVSPADGVIRDMELIKESDNPIFGNADVLRIGIFLSVLDVHLNRAPCDFKVEFKKYTKGAFHDARHEAASRENESTIIGGTASANKRTFTIAVKQISGAIARRIVTPIDIGTELIKGERYGMIKFGSRTELYLPACDYITASVKIGDKVSAGTTVIAKVLSEQAQTDRHNKS